MALLALLLLSGLAEAARVGRHSGSDAFTPANPGLAVAGRGLVRHVQALGGALGSAGGIRYTSTFVGAKGPARLASVETGSLAVEQWPKLKTLQGPHSHLVVAREHGCSYRDLESAAQFRELEGKVVEFRFQEKTLLFGMKKAADGAFEEVEWWDESLQGQELGADEHFVDKYTGRFAFSRNVGRLLRGFAPFFDQEERDSGNWKEEEDRGKLAREVLDFALGLGRALNKLPLPKEPVELYRGGWVVGSVVKRLLEKPKEVRLPWFQSTSADELHTFKFMLSKYGPNDVDIGEIEDDLSYPVHFTFNTRRAKDVRHWNEEEQEHILLPNLPFEVERAEKIVNDPIAYMSTEELATWLETKHDMPEWVTEAKKITEAGPWPEAAAAVRAKGISGQAFAKADREMTYYGPCELMGLEELEQGFYEALEARFILGDKFPWAYKKYPFFLEVHLQDGKM